MVESNLILGNLLKICAEQNISAKLIFELMIHIDTVTTLQ